MKRVASNPHDFSLHSHATATLSSFGAPLIVQKRRDERPAADRHYQRYDAKVCIKYVCHCFQFNKAPIVSGQLLEAVLCDWAASVGQNK